MNFLYLNPKFNKHKTTCFVEHSCFSCDIITCNVKHTWNCPLFTLLGKSKKECVIQMI